MCGGRGAGGEEGSAAQVRPRDEGRGAGERVSSTNGVAERRVELEEEDGWKTPRRGEQKEREEE